MCLNSYVYMYMIYIIDVLCMISLHKELPSFTVDSSCCLPSSGKVGRRLSHEQPSSPGQIRSARVWPLCVEMPVSVWNQKLPCRFSVSASRPPLTLTLVYKCISLPRSAVDPQLLLFLLASLGPAGKAADNRDGTGFRIRSSGSGSPNGAVTSRVISWVI